jgi:hypothetical protein
MIAESATAQTLFKQKKYFGPIPFNTVSVSVGFLDGPDMELLADDLDNWAATDGRNGFDNFELFSTSPFARIGYERQLTPNYFLRTSITFGYLEAKSVGRYVSIGDVQNYDLDIRRTFKVYLFSLEGGFSYYFLQPEVRQATPYAGVGFAAVVPLARLDTESTIHETGEPFSNPGENVSRNSFQAGIHGEFGLLYYITNRYSAGLEGRYQMSQSTFYTHGGNSVIDYAGFTLSMNFNYHF